MPRPNAPRSIAGELSLARRLAYEREARGWSLDGLASRMTQVGCPIHASALYKIEKGDPPRRITVDELVALSRVFDIGVEDLLAPPERAITKKLHQALSRLSKATDRLFDARTHQLHCAREVVDLLVRTPGVAQEVAEYTGLEVDDLASLLEDAGDDGDPEDAERLDLLRRLV